MMVALFIMGAAVPQALLKRADEASGAYVSCLFGVSRQANAARLPVTEFERKLEASCQAEERLVTDLDRRIFTLRGEPSPQSLAEELARDARRQVIESFRQLPDQERALEELGRTCQQNPESCR